MNRRAFLFVVLSFFSSLGDSVFLTGIPLFLFQAGGESLVQANYASVAIAIAVLATKLVSSRLPNIDPLLSVGIGECLMAAIELVVLALYILTGEKWVILAGVLPLAFVYNLYAPYKFFRIQDRIVEQGVFQYSAWIAAAQRFGFLAGVAVSGWLLTWHGVRGILIFDAASFAAYGAIVLGLYRYRLPAMAHSPATPLESGPSTPSLRGFRFGITALAILTAASVFGSWEQSNAIAVASKTVQQDLGGLALARAIQTGAGVAAALLVTNLRPDWSFIGWVISLVGAFFCVPLLSLTNPQAAVGLLFFLGGAASCFRIPVAREIYRAAEASWTDGKSVLSRQWIYNAMLNFALPAVAWGAEVYPTPSMPPLFFSVLGVAVLGIFGGVLVASLLSSRRKITGPGVAAAGALLLLLSGCAKDPETPYRTALLGRGPDTLDPATILGYNSLTLLSQVCGRLTSVDQTLNIEGDLASGWEISPDRKTIVFSLRPGRQFADGTEVSIDDVLFSIQRMVERRHSVAATWTKEVAKIEALPPDRIRIALKAPNPRLLYTLSHPHFCILRKARPFLETAGMQIPNSSGAYGFSGVRLGTFELRASPDFASRAVEKRIDVLFLDQPSAIAAFKNGDLHDLSFYLLQDDEIEQLRAQANIYEIKMYWNWVVSANPDSPLFQSRENRQLFFNGLDRARVAREWRTMLAPAGGLIPSGMIGHTTDAAETPTPKGRRSLFCGKPLTVYGISGMPSEESLGRALEREIREATNCAANVRFLDMQEWSRARTAREADLYVHGLDTNSTDPLGFFREFISGESDNVMGFDDRELTELYRRLYEMTPSQRSAADYRHLQSAFDRAAFAWVIGYPTFKFVYAPSVQNVQMNPLGMHLNRWWQIGRRRAS